MKLPSLPLPTLLTLMHPITATLIHSTPHLHASVYYTSQTPVHYQNTTLLYSPTAYTVIFSAHEAVLIDVPTVPADGTALASWIARTAPGRKLKYIYITHSHADHFNAFPAVLAAFPDAHVIATSSVKARMPAQYAAPLWGFWSSLFPGIARADLSLVHELPADPRFYLDDGRHEFRPIPLGGGDTADSTVLHVPGLDLLVGGDAVYGQSYQYLAENPTFQERQAWIQNLEAIKALEPRFVVPSHSQVGEDFGVGHLRETQEYIERWGEWVGRARSWEELEEWAKGAYPRRVGTFILRYTAQSFFNATG